MMAWRARAVALAVALGAALPACDAEDRPFSTPSEREDEAALLRGSGVTATLDRMEDGAWRVRYAFDAPHELVFFSRSLGDYRTGTWTPLSDGVTLRRIGEFDALAFDPPADSVAFRIEPFSEDIARSYTPFIPFTDGGVAIHAGQFELLTAESAEAIAALDGEMQNYDGEQPMLGVRVLADATIIAGGESNHGEGSDISLGGTSYLYVGETAVEEGPDYVGVIDPGLPAWLREALSGELGAVFGAYRSLWGEGLPEKASVLYAFRGFGDAQLSNHGGALGAEQIMLESSGQLLREPNPRIAVYMRWFFAHEIAHLFQNRTGAHAAQAGDTWIFEGGANAMANIALNEIGMEDPDRPMSDYSETFEVCATYLEAAPLNALTAPDSFDAHYRCGDLISRASAAALPGHDLFDIWNAMLAAMEDREDKGLSTELYLTTIRDLGAAPEATAAIERIVRERQTDPRRALAQMLIAAGLDPGFPEGAELTPLAQDAAR